MISINTGRIESKGSVPKRNGIQKKTIGSIKTKRETPGRMKPRWEASEGMKSNGKSERITFKGNAEQEKIREGKVPEGRKFQKGKVSA